MRRKKIEKQINDTDKIMKPAQVFWLKYKKSKSAMLGLVVFAIIVLIALFASVIVDYDTQVIAQDISNKLQTPSLEHWFGTDAYGRDMFARIVYGTRISLVIGVTTTAVSMFFGIVLGSISGYFGNKIDSIIMRIMDVFMSIPSMLLAIAVVASLGSGIVNIMIAVTIAIVPGYARIVRASVLSIKNKEYVQSARAIGDTHFNIIRRHILPNCAGTIIVQATLGVGSIIITAAGLSFLGLGISPPTPEWGSMLAEGKEYIRYYPHLVVIPGLAIMITVLSLNLLGDGLRDALDPQNKL